MMHHLKSMSLEEAWYIAKDPHNIGKNEGWEREVSKDAVEAYVPSIIQQFFPCYHGVAYYWCKFKPTISIFDSERAVLRFGGADYFAEVWLNSVYLGSYEGGETPFSFDVTNVLNADQENLLAVRIVNPCDRDIDGMNLNNTPHRNKTVKWRAGSGLNSGGLWYGVTLSALPAVYIEDEFFVGDIHSGKISITVHTNSVEENIVSAVLSACVYEKSAFGDKKAEKMFEAEIAAGKDEYTFTITLSDFKLWSIEEPNLYTITLSLASDSGCHTVSSSFGFREFLLKDGFFYLNGKKIFLKSAHSGNAFPVGQMLPVHEGHLRQDFVYAKACGFNTLRAIAGLFRPEQLELADEIGLLIYEECYASWCLGYSEMYTWKDEEELSAIVKEKHADMPIGDEKQMLKRWISSTENMILRDRNHPSVVIWGLLNETKNNSVFRTARDFLPRARALDPTRVIILSSGRWDYDLTLGSASNPYSTVWENTWGADGQPELWDKDMPQRTIGDSHYYPLVPVDEVSVKTFRNMGKEPQLPVFLSESGIGANFHVIEEWKNFLAHGYRTDLEDAVWLKKQTDDFVKDFYAFGLESLFSFPDALLKESQRLSADERKRFFDIVRSNSRLAGYSLTGLLDHGMCGEGLWSYWRRWKPEMFDTVSEGWAPLRFSLFIKPCVYVGEKVTLEAVLANDGVLKDGRYTADFAIENDQGVVMRFTESFDLSAEEFAVPIVKTTVELHVPAGKYRFTANLREGVAAADAIAFTVFEKQLPIASIGEVYAVGISEDELASLRSIVPTIKPYEDGKKGTVLIGKTNGETVEQMIDAAKRGMSVVFLISDIFSDEEVVKPLHKIDAGLALKNYLDWLYHKDYALFSKDLFAGIEGKLISLTAFGEVFANQSFDVGRMPEEVLCPGFLTGYYGVEGAYASTHAILGYRYGKGTIYLNAFKLLSNIGHPIADKILFNLIGMLDKH